jgi:hypothetical protein
METFRDYRRIDGYDNYVISNYGEVFDTTSGKVRNTHIGGTGYYLVDLYKDTKRKTYKIHRLIATYFIENPEQKGFVDHIDNNRLNNHPLNLRWATRNENNHNSQLSKKNTSGVKGVYWNKRDKKWVARIFHNYKQYNLGYFTNIEDAIIARRKKAKELFGEYTNSCEKDDDE